ncbi:Yos1-like protein [Linnemannia elongata]|uniref:Yos1-like protein n=3 Tax=Linnemannia TaxID=2779861 RepID=A0A9P6RBE7_9FUNG|nr:hypothetical protein BGZ47_005316 [Haplosporangium gracile]KAF9142371.1 hypothetical protein BGX30_002800 [Mortierella sp. GBA39]KAF9147892.1 hypothetical protein BG015_010391 [Linnemannia schmuckeri]KAF9294355.1 hypothetical protein BGZ88_003998 [Linnemannia elongata]KAG0315057.1 hypothetical protein BGZ97_008695 [Linnemannia gamsii]OAQ26554.1 Yos1-like protein [Linnemannia elongata AG-77]
MAIGIFGLLEVMLIFINAIAILNEDRFLAKIGWGRQVADPYGQESIKARLVNLISAVRTLMRIPLIGLNIVAILYLVILG